jgi:hypothetical protein
MSVNFKKLIRENINRVLRSFGLELLSFRPDTDFILDGDLRELRIAKLSEVIHDALKGTWLEWDCGEFQKAISEFDSLMVAPPFKQAVGGAGYVNGLLLFVITRRLNPTYVIESGIFRGFSTWVLRKAAPTAEIHSFDIDFSHLDYKDPDTKYHKCDWTEIELDIPDGAFGFFDDHINQAKRILEAANRGLHQLLFDDDISLTSAYADTPSIIPKVSMVLDDELHKFGKIGWQANGRRYAVPIDSQQVASARDWITDAIGLPPLRRETMFHSSPYTAVRLRK